MTKRWRKRKERRGKRREVCQFNEALRAFFYPLMNGSVMRRERVRNIKKWRKFFSWGFSKYKNEWEGRGFGNENIKILGAFYVEFIFFMLRIFFSTSKGILERKGCEWEGALERVRWFYSFFLLLSIAKLLCPKIVIFFRPFPKKKRSKIHTESFFITSTLSSLI